MSLMYKNKEIGGFPDIDTVVTSDSSNPVSSKAVYNAIAEKASNIAINKSTLGYKCKNLLTYPYLYTTRTIQGVDWIDNGDGTVTVSGTNTDTTALSIFNCVTRLDTTIPLFLEAGTYILNGCPSGGSNSTYCIQVGRTKNEAFDRLGYDYGEGITFTLEETTQIQVQLMVGIGATVDNITFKPMLRYAEIEDETWEQYIPSVRTEIDNTKSSIALNKSTLGYECKNLIPYPYHSSTGTRYGITWTLNEDGSINAVGTADAETSYAALVFLSRVNTVTPFYLKKGKYILTGCPSGGSEEGYSLYIERSDVNGNYQYIGTDYGEGCYFEISEAQESLPIQLSIHVKTGESVDKVFYPMIRLADIDDDTFEAYTPSVDTRLDAIESDVSTLKTSVVNKGDLLVPYQEINSSNVITYTDTTYNWSEYKGFVLGLQVIGSDSSVWVETRYIPANFVSLSTTAKHGISIQQIDYRADAYVQINVNTNTLLAFNSNLTSFIKPNIFLYGVK